MIIPRVLYLKYLLPTGDSPSLFVPSGALSHQLVNEGESLEHVGGNGVGGGDEVRHGQVTVLVSGEGDLNDLAVIKGEPVDQEGNC